MSQSTSLDSLAANAKALACTRARSTKYDAAICIGQLSLVNYMISRLVSSKYCTATKLTGLIVYTSVLYDALKFVIDVIDELEAL